MRVFAGLPLESGLASEIGRCMGDWRETCRGLKMVEPRNLHITIYFFGELTAAQVEHLTTAMECFKMKTVDGSLGEIGWFPSRKIARVFFLGVDKGQAEIVDLHKTFSELVFSLGFGGHKRRFVPHITLARSRRGVTPRPYTGFESLRGRPVSINRFVLYESRLSAAGPEYDTLKEILLKT